MKSVMLISNAAAGSVSRELKETIVEALEADFSLEVTDTQRRSHATELAAEAVSRGVDAVVAFGGDGTINEVAQGLIDSGVSFGFIPGGTTNVLARSLGMPRDPMEATALVAARILSATTRPINVGKVNERYFLLSAGVGLDAEVVRRVEADPETKRRRGEWFFLSNALKVGFTQYRGAAPWIQLDVPGRPPERVVLAICCNGRPFTFFKRLTVDLCPEARLEGGLDVFGLTGLRAPTIPRIAWALLVSGSHVRWKKGRYFRNQDSFSLRCDVPLPLQVDGDYVGMIERAEMSLVRDALQLLV